MRFNIAILIFAMFSIQSCGDIFEEDISSKNVYVVYPPALYNTSELNHEFSWDYVDGAIDYQVQVFSEVPGGYFLTIYDTVVSVNSVDLSLYPDTFEWQIRALNYSSATDYTEGVLTINSDSSLTGLMVELLTPSEWFYSNQRDVLFTWTDMANVDNYRFDIRVNSWEGDAYKNPQILFNDTIEERLQEGIYAWGVQGQNEGSSTIFSHRFLEVDTTRPVTPNISYPGNNAVINTTGNSIPMGWQHSLDDGSPLFDSLFLSNDSAFSTFIIEEKVSNASYYFTPLDSEDYYWYLKPFDAAGNIGSETEVYKFTVNIQ